MSRFIIISLSLAFLWPSMSYSDKLYMWKDDRGVTCITDTPPTNQNKARTITYERDDPTDIERWEQERRQAFKQQEATRKANERREAQRIAAEARKDEARRAQAKVQEARNKRASALERAVDSTIRSAGRIDNEDLYRKAAAVKAQQIREGTDVPMSQAEDMEYHMRQAIDREVRHHEILNH